LLRPLAPRAKPEGDAFLSVSEYPGEATDRGRTALVLEGGVPCPAGTRDL
jgi:hypothetical protein